jgi:hypothetical protein
MFREGSLFGRSLVASLEHELRSGLQLLQVNSLRDQCVDFVKFL